MSHHLAAQTRNQQGLSLSVTTESVALIRDYYQYLVSCQSFVVTKLEAVLFFKTEPILNQIYRELIERRHLSVDPNKKNWMKRLVNLSCVFFGFQSSLEDSQLFGRRQYSIHSRLPQTYNLANHHIDIHHGFTHLSNFTFLSCLFYQLLVVVVVVVGLNW